MHAVIISGEATNPNSLSQRLHVIYLSRLMEAMINAATQRRDLLLVHVRSYVHAGLANTRNHSASSMPSKGRSHWFAMTGIFSETPSLYSSRTLVEFRAMSEGEHQIVPYCIVCQK